MNDFPTWVEWASESLACSPYRDLIHKGLELHFEPITDDDDLLDEWQNKWPVASGPYNWRIDCAKKDRPVGYHPKLIRSWGTSWWDYAAGQTVALFLEFDYKHGPNGLDEAGIAQVDELATKHSAIMNITSRGGKGRHWVARLTTPLPATTRKQHARNCKAARDALSKILGVDLSTLTCAAPGAIQYVWHHAPAEGGFQLLHAATGTLDVELPPPEPEPEPRSDDDPCWDDTHEEIFDAMRADGWPVTFKDYDGKPMVQLHACGLLADFKRNRRAGRYSTNSPGTHKDKPNAYGFPRENGGIAVYRMKAEAESKDWHIVNGKPCIHYNVPASFDEAVKRCGKFDRRGHGIITNFDEFTRLLGIDLTIPRVLWGREIVVRRDNTCLYITILGEKEDVVEGWHYSRKTWEYDLDCLPDEKQSLSDRIRQTTDKYAAKAIVIQDGPDWVAYSLTAAKTYLQGCGLNKFEVAKTIKDSMENSYQLVQIPFGPEYPAPRVWNRFGAKYACEPIKGDYPRIQMILEHCGKNLTPAVLDDPWCQANKVTTGGHYLKLWAARAFRYPDKRLPMLDLFSEVQNIGKSTFGRTLARGIKGTNGWCELRKEITRDDFNDAMRGAVLCLLEEIDLSANPSAYQLIKNYIDNPHLKLRGMYSPSETETNYTHFIHTSNDRRFCPVYPNDTRIVVIRVDPFEGEELDWSETLRPIVDEEMPAFLYDLMDMNLPKGDGRLYLPVLVTDDKRAAMDEKRAEMQGWYSQLLADARGGWIDNLTAANILQRLVEETTDKKLPKSAAGLASNLMQLKKQMVKDGFMLTIAPGDKKDPARYSMGIAV